MPLRRFHRYQALPAAGAALAAITAVALFARYAGAALADRQGLSVGTGGSLGTMQLTLAVLLCLRTTFLGRRQSQACASLPMQPTADGQLTGTS